jgi:hypothetical protein
MSDEVTVAPRFQHSIDAATRLARPTCDIEPDAHDLPTALLRGAATLQLASVLLDVDYQVVHEADHTGWLRLSFFAEGLYQQLHATTSMAVMLADRTNPPVVGCKSLGSYLDVIERQPDHPTAARVAASRRELDLLRWMCTVRNKAIQHRAEEGYTGGRGVIMPSRFAQLSATDQPTSEAIEHAIEVFHDLATTFGPWDVQPMRSREVITYLDFASHELLPTDPEHFDIARRAVSAARAYDVVVSPPMLENTDVALARLIALAIRDTERT